jgi:hypothetical protein
MVDVGVGEDDEIDRARIEGKARWFLARVSRPPWNMPQSTRKRTPSASTR